jgi:hypothetical protein
VKHAAVLSVLSALAFLCLCAATAAAAGEINPFPRALLETNRVSEWTFNARHAAGWTAAHQCSVAAGGGALRITSTGEDPYVLGPAMSEPGPITLNLRMKSAGGGGGQVFWATDKTPGFAEGRSTHFDILHDNQWHEYAVPLEAQGTITRLRLDPGTAAGEIEVSRIAIASLRLHPLEIVRVEQAGAEIRAEVQNHSAEALSFTAGDKPYTAEAGKSVQVSLPAPHKQPFEAVTIAVKAKGLPPVSRTVFLCHPDVPGDFVTRKAGGLSVTAARDGSGAFLNVDDTVVAAIAPLALRDGAVPRLRQDEKASGIRFAGEGVSVEIGVRPDEVAVSVASTGPVEGPVVRAIGDLEAGLLAGLEYLGKGEPSSSTLDIETPEHVRFAPEPLKVTMPLMAAVTDRGAVAMTWKDMSLQPVFASPNFFDGSPDHRMALRGMRIEATILVRRGPAIEDAILWAVRKNGLPPVPPPPRDPKAQAALCLAALNGPIKGEGGWGHCAEANWSRQPFADIASTIWRLTGEAPALPRLVPGGAHVRNDAIYFVTGRANDWLRVHGGQARALLASQQADGWWRYKGPYQRGHFEDTASGHCARNATTLLDYAHVTGDAAALEGGTRALDFMKRFQVPRGAQTWELSLHTPDILASAYLVWAYVRGYELTGKAEYLAEARRWALSGLPFVYQWTRHPVMLYATVPVYGATNWRAPNWMGLPVQWCGGVYAYALALLAPYEKTLDWGHVARGILVSAEMQQAPDGPMAGCLPDSFNLAAQKRNGPFINPCALLSLRTVLDGQLDSIAVATDGKHRAAAPFPVTVQAGKATVRAKKGVAYQVLIDGTRVVDVKSEGTDVLPLE